MTRECSSLKLAQNSCSDGWREILCIYFTIIMFSVCSYLLWILKGKASGVMLLCLALIQKDQVMIQKMLVKVPLEQDGYSSPFFIVIVSVGQQLFLWCGSQRELPQLGFSRDSSRFAGCHLWNVNRIMSNALLMANVYRMIVVREFHLSTLIHIYLMTYSFWIHLLTGQPFSPRLEGKVRTAGFTVTWGNHVCSFLNYYY